MATRPARPRRDLRLSGILGVAVGANGCRPRPRVQARPSQAAHRRSARGRGAALCHSVASGRVKTVAFDDGDSDRRCDKTNKTRGRLCATADLEASGHHGRRCLGRGCVSRLRKCSACFEGPPTRQTPPLDRTSELLLVPHWQANMDISDLLVGGRREMCGHG